MGHTLLASPAVETLNHSPWHSAPGLLPECRLHGIGRCRCAHAGPLLWDHLCPGLRWDPRAGPHSQARKGRYEGQGGEGPWADPLSSSRPSFSTIIGSYQLSPNWQSLLCSSGRVRETQVRLLEQKGNLLTFSARLRKNRDRARARASNTIRMSLLPVLALLFSVQRLHSLWPHLS